MITFTICFFFFEILEKTFTASIVKRITFLRKRLHNIKRVEKLPEGEGRAPTITDFLFWQYILMIFVVFCSFERKIAFAFLRKAKKKIIKIFIVQNAEKAEISEDFRRLS